ncbi:MAG TPA: APC family permease [Acidobacteriota bacterium]|jgi:amino acid transporter|nr:APC family permease [Acidobacteriota bacterium]
MADLQVKTSPQVRVVVATTIMLSFISFWRAAAIVLNDLGSSAFYAGGIAEKAVGPAAPWFILAIMLFSYAVRAVYVESCAMFTRAGVYRVVRESMGGTLAKLSVSALMFDYILTGPISGVSAGQYIINLIAQTVTYFGHPWTPSDATVNHLAALIAILVTLYFWRRNTKGIHESSDDALKIMYVTTVMVVMLLLWSGITLLERPETRRLPPAPNPQNLSFNSDAVGWLPKIAPGVLRTLPNTSSPALSPVLGSEEPKPRYGMTENAGALLGLLGILIALGHSILAMSGEESLAQVNRELEYPKHKNLMRAGIVIFIYSLLFTSLVSFFAYAFIPDGVRFQYKDNLISGIASYLVGPVSLKLMFNGFIVVVGFLMLSGAVNTAIIGSNGVLNRVSEDGVLTEWFRAPHRKYGTTHRMINLIVGLQLVAIIASAGDTYALGEAYAFGVIWSFIFNSLATIVLRYTHREQREWKVPCNIRLGNKEIPLGLVSVALILISIALVNMVTKQVATVSGLAFTLVFFSIFTISERVNERRRARRDMTVDEFRLSEKEIIDAGTMQSRPGSILVPARDYNTLDHLEWVLNRVNPELRDVIVMTAKVIRGPLGGSEFMPGSGVFSDYEQLLFSRVVALAEKHGKPVKLIVVPTTDIFQAIAQTADNLQIAEIVAGASAKMSPDEQARRLGAVWENLPGRQRKQLVFKVVTAPGNVRTYYLGAHAPNLTQDDINLIHSLWLELTAGGHPEVHHRDVVRAALEELQEEMRSKGRDAVFDKIVHRAEV